MAQCRSNEKVWLKVPLYCKLTCLTMQTRKESQGKSLGENIFNWSTHNGMHFYRSNTRTNVTFISGWSNFFEASDSGKTEKSHPLKDFIHFSSPTFSLKELIWMKPLYSIQLFFSIVNPIKTTFPEHWPNEIVSLSSHSHLFLSKWNLSHSKRIYLQLKYVTYKFTATFCPKLRLNFFLQSTFFFLSTQLTHPNCKVSSSRPSHLLAIKLKLFPLKYIRPNNCTCSRGESRNPPVTSSKIMNFTWICSTWAGEYVDCLLTTVSTFGASNTSDNWLK